MADSTGSDAATGALLTDWGHVQQSIAKILTTPLGSRVMRRDFGSRLPDLVDRKMTQLNILAVYAEAAQAIDKWEPRFRMRQGALVNAGPDGVLTLALLGTYFPLAHRGDYSVAADASTRIVFEGRA